MTTYEWEIYNSNYDTLARGYLYEKDPDIAEKRVREFFANTAGASSYYVIPVSD